MLRIECPDCKECINSPFLSEMDETRCPKCGVTVQVKDVYVSAGPYSIYREVLLRSMFKYKRLLAEAGKELEEMEKAGIGHTAHRESVNSVKSFMKNLQEMLDGCRSAFRISDRNARVRCAHREKDYAGTLVNISTTGACVNFEGNNGSFRKGEEAALEFYGHGPSTVFRVKAEVMWSDNKEGIGVRFLNMDERLRKSLLDYVQVKEKE